MVADAVLVSILLGSKLCDHSAEHGVLTKQLADVVDLAVVLALAVTTVVTPSLRTTDGALVLLPMQTIMVSLHPPLPTIVPVDGVVLLLLLLLPRQKGTMADGDVSPKSTVLLLHPLLPSRSLHLPMMTTVDGAANQRRSRLLPVLTLLLPLFQKRSPSRRKMMADGVVDQRRSRRLLRPHLRRLRNPRWRQRMADGVESLKELSNLRKNHRLKPSSQNPKMTRSPNPLARRKSITLPTPSLPPSPVPSRRSLFLPSKALSTILPSRSPLVSGNPLLLLRKALLPLDLLPSRSPLELYKIPSFLLALCNDTSPQHL